MTHHILKYELAKLTKDQAAEMAKLKADLAKKIDKLTALPKTYEGHTHDSEHISFDLVPTKAKCFDSNVCKNDIL